MAGKSTKQQPGPAPYKWSAEIEDEIFDRIAGGEAIRNICKDDWLPSWPTVNKRLAADDAFAARYARAREDQAATLFDQCLTIADSQEDDIAIVDGKETVNHDVIARAKLRIDTRKWMASKLAPKVYGDKLTHASDPENPMPAQQVTIFQLPDNGRG
jgi:hypothetical protein